jgi:hypothetical protein
MPFSRSTIAGIRLLGLIFKNSGLNCWRSRKSIHRFFVAAHRKNLFLRISRRQVGEASARGTLRVALRPRVDAVVPSRNIPNRKLWWPG